MMTNTTNTITTNTPLLFAETTIYGGGKNSMYKTFSSNIMVKYTSKYHEEKQRHPLYQIYRESKNYWGVWKSPYSKYPWEKPKFYLSFEKALKVANQSFLEDDLSEDELDVKTQAYIIYHKNEWEKGKRFPKIHTLKEDTFYTIKAEE